MFGVMDIFFIAVSCTMLIIGSSQQPVVKKLKRDEDLWLEKYKPKSEVTHN